MFAIRFISTILTLCLLALSATAAVMPGQEGSGQFVTLCAGGQSVWVELDHSGAPVEPRAQCPEAITLAVLPHAAPAAPLVSLETRLHASTVEPCQSTPLTPTALARAPPAIV